MTRDETRYRCTNCGAEDSDRATYGPSPQALICYNCKQGVGMPVSQQVSEGVGMIPLAHPYWLTNG